MNKIYISKSKEDGKKYQLIDLSGLYKVNTNYTIDLAKIFYISTLPYATKENFTGINFYNSETKPLVRKELVIPLIKAAYEFSKMGFRIKILDAFREEKIQREFYKIALQRRKEAFVANPDGYGIANPFSIGSIHTKACSVDITLVTKNASNTWREIEMPSAYDSFIPESSPNYVGNGVSKKAIFNRNLLINTIKEYGFNVHPNEWWHFDYKDSFDDEIFPLLTNVEELYLARYK